jgi:hypothetical protein
MSIKTKNGGKFTFITDDGLEAVAPLGSDIYVHITDNGNGTHSAYGKVRKATENGKQELGFHRGEIPTLPSNTADLFAKAHEALAAQFTALNPDVEFLIELK